MESDDDRLDDEPAFPLLPPDDRIWRHPSEVTAAPPRPVGHAVRAGRQPPRLVTTAALTGAISALLTLGVVAAVDFWPRQHDSVSDIVDPPRLGAPAHDLAAMAVMVERLRPSIVRIEADGDAGTAAGSGVVFRSDGLAFTNHRLVAGSLALRVLLHAGRRVGARLLGGDPETDVALIDLDGDGFPVAALGSALDLAIGEPALTVGASHDAVPGPISMGVVKRLGQPVEAGDVRLLDMIETNAPVGAGCAGGALLDGNGAVVGIASVSVNTESGVVGYATPIDVARVVADRVAATGAVSRVWLGIEGEDVSAERARQLGIVGGATVTDVKPESPAALAGLEPSDVITSVGATTVRSMAGLVLALRYRQPGEAVILSLVRGADRLTATVTLAPRAQPSR